MSEREKSDSERPEPGESWTGFNIPEFGDADAKPDAAALESRSEGMSFAEALEAHAGGSDWASEQTRAAEERGATSESRTDWTAVEGQYIASGDDANSWAAGQEWAEPRHELPQSQGWTSAPAVAPVPAPPQPAPASSPEKPTRKGLIIALAAGALVVIGAIIAAVLLLPGMLGDTTPTTSPDAGSTTSAETSAPPPGDAVGLNGTWDGTTKNASDPDVNYVVTLQDDGTTVSGTVEYTAFGCTSRLEQAARDASTVTFNEYGVSGSCTYDDTQIILHMPTAQNPDTATLEIGMREGTLVRR